jgi:hypothetical protein
MVTNDRCCPIDDPRIACVSPAWWVAGIERRKLGIRGETRAKQAASSLRPSAERLPVTRREARRFSGELLADPGHPSSFNLKDRSKVEKNDV